jgi:hypothetical protein
MTMLERAARVLASSFGDDWDDLSEEIRESLRDDIRAVLQVIREPSEAMVERGCFCDDLRSDRPGGSAEQDRHWMACSWRSMIDAALSD